MTRLLIAAAATAAMVSAASAQTPPPAAPPAAVAPGASAPAPVTLPAAGDIDDTIKASGQFTILAKAIDASGLTTVMKSHGPLTLLAPTDAAFQSLPPGQLDALMKPAAAQQLQGVLAYHLINAEVPLSKVQGAKGPIATVAGPQVMIDGTSTPVRVNDAQVLGETQVSNGMIYIIDKVLTPPAAGAAP